MRVLILLFLCFMIVITGIAIKNFLPVLLGLTSVFIIWATYGSRFGRHGEIVSGFVIFLTIAMSWSAYVLWHAKWNASMFPPPAPPAKTTL